MSDNRYKKALNLFRKDKEIGKTEKRILNELNEIEDIENIKQKYTKQPSIPDFYDGYGIYDD